MLSFSFGAKETRGGRDPLVSTRAKLEELDIKSLLAYVYGHTTHVVTSKRNTAKGLQALINGRYIVHESFIDSLVFAATPVDLDSPESVSPLEEDFDGSFPDAMEHLPPAGKEPHPRPAEDFAPDPKRATVFDGFTFVFSDTQQFETLQPPISNGHGKGLFFELKEGETTAEEYVQFVRNAAGNKGTGDSVVDKHGKGVLVVRFRTKGPNEDWAIDLGDRVAMILKRRLVEQSEFLEAILRGDAKILSQPLSEVDEIEDVHTREHPRNTSLSIRVLLPYHTR